MKKILPALLVLFIFLTLPVHAASGRLTAKADAAGDTVTVTVRLDNPGIIATRIFVRYDPQALQLTDAKNGEVFPNGNAVFGKDLSADPYTMLWDESLRRDNNTTSGTLCTLTFAVIGGSANGTTNVKIAVDKSSTFDVDLNAVTVADGSCDVPVPSVTTKANATAATTNAAQPSTPKPSAETTKPAVKTSDPTTAKPVQTTKPTITIPQSTMPQSKPAAAGTTAAGITEQTTKASAVPTTASAAQTPATAAQGTTAGTVTPDGTSAAVPDGTSAADPAADETIPERLTSGTLPESVSETTADAPTEPEPTRASHRNLLWLLLLIPAAAAIVLVVRKKKA